MSKIVSTSTVDACPLANAVLSRVHSLLDEAILAVARRCARAGKLNAALLDEHQFVSYEIALASADLCAAEVACSSIGTASELDAGLCLVFAADAVSAILQRLDTVFVDLGIPTHALASLAHDAELTQFRRMAASGATLARIGVMAATADAEIGSVEQPEAVAMAQHAFHRFAQAVIAPIAGQIHRDDLTVPEAIVDGMREMGAFGLSIPEAYGGSASDTSEDASMMIAVTETLSEASLGAGGSLITRPEILSRALLMGGSDAQKQYWLPRIASGETLCAIAITEPDFGSDVASVALKGTRTAGGWLLNGAKTWCTFAGMAHLLMVVTRTDPDPSAGHRGLSIMLVDKPSTRAHEFSTAQDGGGRLSGRAIATIGYRGMHSFDLHFENFFVPDEAVLGGESGLGQGFYYTMAGMTGGRLQTAARASGVMHAALCAAIQYARDRKVFGAPLLTLPLTQVKIARMAARYAACRKLTYAVAKSFGSAGSPMAASQVKLLACRSAEMVTREALQMHGGMGYAEESAVSRYFVDARVLSIFEGAEETLALKVIARSLFETALLRAEANTLEPAHAV